MLRSAADAVNAGIWFSSNESQDVKCRYIKNFLPVRNIGLALSSVADFLNSMARVLTSAERASYLPERKAICLEHTVWIKVTVIFRWLFCLINRRYPKRLEAVIFLLNNLFLIYKVIPPTIWWRPPLTELSAAFFFTSTMLFPIVSVDIRLPSRLRL